MCVHVRVLQAGWVAFATSFVVILCGLMATLILLALLKKPLPALPFSMLFGASLVPFGHAMALLCSAQ